MSGVLCRYCHKQTGSLNNICRWCSDRLFKNVFIDKEAIDASRTDEGAFVKLAEEALVNARKSLNKRLELIRQSDNYAEGASEMLLAVSKFVDISEIQEQIWKEFNKEK